VNGAGDTVLQLQVHLGDGVVGKDGGVGNITCRKNDSVRDSSSKPFVTHACARGFGDGRGSDGLRHTNSGRFDHVSDGESLDSLVLGCASGAVGASDWFDVATAFLVASAVRIPVRC
jgi:hypothetical protein